MRGLILVMTIIAGGVLKVHLDVAFAVFVILFERLPADEDLDRELSVARHCVSKGSGAACSEAVKAELGSGNALFWRVWLKLPLMETGK